MKKLLLLLLICRTFAGYSQKKTVIAVEKDGIELILNNGITLRDSVFIVVAKHEVIRTTDLDSVYHSITLDVYQGRYQIRNYANHNQHSPLFTKTWRVKIHKATGASWNDVFINLRDYIKGKFNCVNNDITDINGYFVCSTGDASTQTIQKYIELQG